MCRASSKSVEQIIEPSEGILAAASAIDADLIVLGNHGYSGWDRVLGTTASKVVNGSHRNVLVVYDVSRNGTGEASLDEVVFDSSLHEVGDGSSRSVIAK